MSLIAPCLQAFFSERLAQQRRASPRTVAAYRDSFRLLLEFVHQRTGKQPSDLSFEQLDAPCIGLFLVHLERERGNSVRTRNARLAAIHSFFRYAAFRHPEHAELIQRVLAIPHKRFERVLVEFLNPAEVTALLAAPDRSTWLGRRDHALLVVALQTGLRLSELTALRLQDLELGAGAHLRCQGKGRKERSTPLLPQTVAALRVWLQELRPGPTDFVFPSRLGGRLSADAFGRLVAKHAQTAASRLPSLKGRSVTPHVLRHTSAMQLLQAGIDTTVIALWLGHESPQTTQIYLHADLSLKERALSRTSPPNVRPGRYRPPDTLIAFLSGL